MRRFPSLQNGLSSGRLLSAAIVLLAGVLYFPAIKGVQIWDDFPLLDGRAIGGGVSFWKCFTEPFLDNYFRPLVSVSFYLERKLWGGSAFFYHQTNLVIHMVTTALLIGLLTEAFRSRRVGLAGGLLFAVQPVQVSAVAWIGGRTDAQCALFMTGFAYALLRAVRSSGAVSRRYLALSLLFFTGALFTKEQVLPALLLVPLGYLCWSDREGETKQVRRDRAIRAALPFLIVVCLFAAFHVMIAPPPGKTAPHAFTDILLGSSRTFCYYALLLAVPTPLTMHTRSLGAFVHAGWLPVPGGLLVAFGSVIAFRHWRRTEPSAAWFLAFIVLTLLMVSNLYPVPSALVVPYRAGVAGVGAAALLGWGMGSLLDRLFALSWRDLWLRPGRRRPFGQAALAAVSGVYLFWCGGLTFWGSGRWQNQETISRTLVQYDPDSVWARYNLTTALMMQHRKREAVLEIEHLLDRLFGSSAWQARETALAAVRQNPRLLESINEIQGTTISAKEWLGSLYSQLGFAYLDTGETEAGRVAFETGYAFDPAGSSLNAGLGVCAFRAGEREKAVGYLRVALSGGSESPESNLLLGRILASEGKWMQAQEQFTAFIRLQPSSGVGYVELAQTQLRQGDRAGAQTTLRDALRHATSREEAQQMLAQMETKTGG